MNPNGTQASFPWTKETSCAIEILNWSFQIRFENGFHCLKSLGRRRKTNTMGEKPCEATVAPECVRGISANSSKQ